MSILFNRKACATCAYWSGARESDVSGAHAKCKGENDLGVCQNPKSSFKKKETKSGYGSCSKWEKWPALKKMK